jgi:hypothetical protein
MLKAIACFCLLTCLIFPFKNFSEEITVCKNGKSSGEFLVASKDLRSIVNCDGVSFYLTEEELSTLLKFYDCKKVFSQTVLGIENIYFYSNKILKKEVIGGERVNFHVALSNGKIVVGIPFIYYGY